MKACSGRVGASVAGKASGETLNGGGFCWPPFDENGTVLERPFCSAVCSPRFFVGRALVKLCSHIFCMRADFANRSHKLPFGYTELMGPIPDFAVVVHIDPRQVRSVLSSAI